MQAHAIIEVVKAFNKIGKIDKKTSNFIVECLDCATKFEFDLDEYPTMSQSVFEENLSTLQLPYPVCYFEVPGAGANIAIQKPNDKYIHIMSFIKFKGMQNWSIYPPVFKLAFDLRDSKLYSLNNDPEVVKEFDKVADDKKEMEALFLAPSYWFRALFALNCSNVAVIDNEPPLALNKKRIRNGKIPLYGYKTLHVKVPVDRTIKPNLGGTHASPRLHLRRGHIRKYATYSIWINDTIVGNKDKGFIEKDYKVKN